jgi:L-rhamnose mutarotase
MIRRAFTMRLKPGALPEYKRHHDNLWPELFREIERSGIAHISTFQRDCDLFLFSEITDEQAWDRLWHSEIHRKWGELMEPLMNFKDGMVDFGELREIFHCETDAGRRKKKTSRTKVTRKKVAKAGVRKKSRRGR